MPLKLVIEKGRVSHVAHAMRHFTNLLRSQKRKAALARLHQSGNHPQQSTFARSVVAQYNVKPAGSEAGGNPADSGEAAKELHQIFQDNDRRRMRVVCTCHGLRFHQADRQRITGPLRPEPSMQPFARERRPVVPAVWEHTWRRTWLEYYWREKLHRVRTFLPPEPAHCL